MSKLPKFTLRISESLHRKMEYLTAISGRSKNKEIEFALKRYIRDFEAKNGAIEIDQKTED